MTEDEVSQNVTARLSGAEVCPDCHQVLTEIVIERHTTQKYRIDYEKKEFIELTGEEYSDDSSLRCPYCDTLNIYDSKFRGFKEGGDHEV